MKMTLKQTVLSTALIAGSLMAATLQAQTLSMSSWVPQSHYLFTDILVPWTKDASRS